MDFQSFKAKYQKIEPEEFKNNICSEPLLSVCVQTYQHAEFIKDCLDGILMQETSFRFEILLGEDDSNDGTREICIEYAKKYPDKIRLFLHHRENNIKVGGQPTGRFNFLYNMFSARGKYIAFCEGDDYWTDQLKLQKQVDYLKNNKEYVLCFHDAVTLNKNGTVQRTWLQDKFKTHIEQEKLKKSPFILTLTLCFKNILTDFPTEFLKVVNADKFLISLLGNYGKGAFLPDVQPTVYRLHEGGIVGLRSHSEREIYHLRTFYYISQFYNNQEELKVSQYFNFKFKKIAKTFLINENYKERLQLSKVLYSIGERELSILLRLYIYLNRIGRGHFLRKLFLRKLDNIRQI